jgi:AcrR family transcriptional regulator
MPTQAERRAATQLALIHHARSAFGRIGFDNVTITELAASAGVTSGALYHHFDSKEALFEAVLVVMEEELVAAVTAAVSGIDDPRSALRAACRAYIERACVPTTARIVLIDGPGALGPARYRAIDESYFMAPLHDLVRAIRPASRMHTKLLARALFAAICEVALHTKRSNVTEADAVLSLLIDAL